MFLSELTIIFEYTSFESNSIDIQLLNVIPHENILTDCILLLYIWLKKHKGSPFLCYFTTDWYVMEILFLQFAILTVADS